MSIEFNDGVVNEFVQVSHNSALAGFSVMTLSTRIKPIALATANWGRIITKQFGSTGDDYHLAHKGEPTAPGCRVRTDVVETGQSTTTMTLSVWHYLQMTWAGVGGDLVLYLNGVEEDRQATTGALKDAAETLSIGNHAGDTDRRFKGLIDDLRIYNRALAVVELAHIRGCKGTDGIHDGLVANWRLNEKEAGAAVSGANSVIDIVGAFNGTSNGTSPIYAESELKYRRRVA